MNHCKGTKVDDKHLLLQERKQSMKFSKDVIGIPRADLDESHDITLKIILSANFIRKEKVDLLQRTKIKKIIKNNITFKNIIKNICYRHLLTLSIKGLVLVLTLYEMLS